MKPANLLKEVIIIAIVFILTWLLYFFSLNWLFGLLAETLFGNSALDINMRDTYFIVYHSWLSAVLLPFLGFITIIYLVRTIINRFKNQLINLVLLISCSGLNILTLYHYEQIAWFVRSTSQGWTIYPPLSALGNKLPRPQPSPYLHTLHIIFIVQILLLLLLVIIAVLTGKNWKATKNVH